VPHYTIDRFEGSDWVVIEDERARTFTVPRQWVPAGAREGTVLLGTAEAHDPATSLIRFSIDPAAHDEHLRTARARLDALPRGPKGDLAL
jgi:hypothetical protein